MFTGYTKQRPYTLAGPRMSKSYTIEYRFGNTSSLNGIFEQLT